MDDEEYFSLDRAYFAEQWREFKSTVRMIFPWAFIAATVVTILFGPRPC